MSAPDPLPAVKPLSQNSATRSPSGYSGRLRAPSTSSASTSATDSASMAHWPTGHADLSRSGCSHGTDERYAREWLEQQTVTGILTVEDASLDVGRRRYSLPSGHVEPLIDRDSLNYVAPLPRLIAGCVRPLATLVEGLSLREGVPFSAYGPDLREGQAAINRPAFLHRLAREWLPAIPDIHARLQTDPRRASPTSDAAMAGRASASPKAIRTSAWMDSTWMNPRSKAPESTRASTGWPTECTFRCATAATRRSPDSSIW